jgi:hypothetical protein
MDGRKPRPSRFRRWISVLVVAASFAGGMGAEHLRHRPDEHGPSTPAMTEGNVPEKATLLPGTDNHQPPTTAGLNKHEGHGTDLPQNGCACVVTADAGGKPYVQDCPSLECDEVELERCRLRFPGSPCYRRRPLQ